MVGFLIFGPQNLKGQMSAMMFLSGFSFVWTVETHYYIFIVTHVVLNSSVILMFLSLDFKKKLLQIVF